MGAGFGCGFFMAQFGQNQSFLAQLGLDQFRHVFVMQPADHRHQGALHTGEASEENERAAHVVVPRCKMIDGQIHDERNASCSFNLGGHHSRCIEPLQAENADAKDVDETFKDAEGGHRYREHRIGIAQEERHDGQRKDEHRGDQTTGSRRLVIDIPLYQLGDKIKETTRILPLFPLVQDEDKAHKDDKFLDAGQFRYEDSHQSNEQHGNHGVDFQRVMFHKFPHNHIY